MPEQYVKSTVPASEVLEDDKITFGGLLYIVTKTTTIKHKTLDVSRVVLELEDLHNRDNGLVVDMSPNIRVTIRNQK